MLNRVAREGFREIDVMAQRSKTPPARVREVAAALAQRGFVTIDVDTVSVTEAGRQVAALIVAAQEEILNEFLEGWSPQEHPDVKILVHEISARLSEEHEGLVAVGSAAQRGSTGPDLN
jgi:DNA-binding MarR family transcriptional regulator